MLERDEFEAWQRSGDRARRCHNGSDEAGLAEPRSQPAQGKVGFPGDAAKRRERIKRAIKANAETLRRLAQ